mgnify:CR=1 FL=1
MLIKHVCCPLKGSIHAYLLIFKKIITMNNKKSIKQTFMVLISTILFTINSYAQDTIHYFNKTYWADTMNLFTSIGVATANGYYLIGNCATSSQESVFVMKTDLAGNQVWWVNVDVKGNEELASLLLGTQAIITKDSCIAFVYTKRVFGNGMLYDNYLVKMRLDGTIIWNRQQISNCTEQAFQVIQTHDNGFALFGFQYCENDTNRYYLVKTDTEGIEQWHNTYLLDNYSVGLSIQQTADHGFIMGGYGYSDTTDYDTYIVKTDSAGTVQWETNFGGDFTDCGGMVNLLANNQYLITGCYSDSNNDIDRHMRFTKLGSAGQIVWDSIYYSVQPLTNPERPLIFLPDSSFVTVLNFRSEITGRRSNWFTHFSLQGDILSQREYTSNPNQDVYIKDIRPTPDGGYILAGYEYTSTPQKGYLVKVDSLGNSCSWVGCDSLGYVYAVGIASPQPPPKEGELFPPPSEGVRGRLIVFPNPSSEQVFITPYSTEKDATFILYNVLGSIVRQVGVGSSTVQVSVLGLPAGTYFYQIVNAQKQTLQHDKLIILH